MKLTLGLGVGSAAGVGGPPALEFLDTWPTTILYDGAAIGFRSNFARIAVRTSLTSLSVTAIPATSWRQVAVYVNGVYDQTVTYAGTAGVAEAKAVTLPAGSNKLVEFVEVAGDEQGACVRLVSIAGGYTNEPAPTPANVCVVLADSIGTGFALTLMKDGWNSQLRYSQSAWAIRSCAISGRLMRSWVLNQQRKDNLISILTALFTGTVKNALFIDLGTNDWATSTGNRTAAQFGTDCTTLRTTVANAFPAMPGLKFVWSSPVSRTGEATPNGVGATLQDLRNAMQGVAVANSDTYNDGSTVLIDPTDLADGLHPNLSGHNKKHTRAGTVLAAL